MTSVPRDRARMASGIMSAQRAIGSTVGFAVMGSILAAWLSATLEPLSRKRCRTRWSGARSRPRSSRPPIRVRTSPRSGRGNRSIHADPATRAAIVAIAKPTSCRASGWRSASPSRCSRSGVVGGVGSFPRETASDPRCRARGGEAGRERRLTAGDAVRRSCPDRGAVPRRRRAAAAASVALGGVEHAAERPRQRALVGDEAYADERTQIAEACGSRPRLPPSRGCVRSDADARSRAVRRRRRATIRRGGARGSCIAEDGDDAIATGSSTLSASMRSAIL